MKKYIFSKLGRTETIINLHFNNNDYQIPFSKFIKEYKISNFYKGKFFLKRLIKKIFKYKIKNKIIWKNFFWNHIKINLIDVKIDFSKNFTSFKEFEIHLKEEYNNKRLIDIYKYKKIIEEQKNIDFPLYITGECINFLGGNVLSNELFMLDGSRRLIATALCKKDSTKIYLMDIKL